MIRFTVIFAIAVSILLVVVITLEVCKIIGRLFRTRHGAVKSPTPPAPASETTTSNTAQAVEVKLAPMAVEEPEQYDEDEIQISGPIPIIGEDPSQTDTQPIPTLAGDKRVEKIVVQDHVMASFYQKLFDPKAYNLTRLILAKMRERHPSVNNVFMAQHAATALRYFESHVVYDTLVMAGESATSQLVFFMMPLGQGGKTRLDTNLYVGGCLTQLPHSFVTKAVILRFPGQTAKTTRQFVIDQGVIVVGDNMNRLEKPLSMFEPLNPFDADPRVFFSLIDEWLVEANHLVRAEISFPGGLQPSEDIRVRVEIPGLRFQGLLI